MIFIYNNTNDPLYKNCNPLNKTGFSKKVFILENKISLNINKKMITQTNSLCQ